MERRHLATLALLGAVLTAGCAAVPTGEPGEVNGYRYDSEVSVTTGDGLNESERVAVVSRAMARIEHIRGVQFTRDTPVEVITRAEFRNRTGDPPDPGELTDRQLWNEQVWEALHIVGEDRTYPESRGTNRGSSVVGYYSSRENEIVIVSDSPTPTIDRQTLVHELVHALQDQQFSLGESREFQDGQLAVRGVVEGEANYLAALYRQQCDSGWACIERPERMSARPSGFNQALFLTSFVPYAEGPQFVERIRERSGWDGVDDLYGAYPESTEQLIHPSEYPDGEPREVTVPDRSNDEWRRFTDIDRPARDVLGEASIYAMFRGNGVVSGGDQYDYSHPLSAGWEGDAIVPYRNGDRYGYVWRTTWESNAEAREFHEGYRQLLDRRNATEMGDGRYRIPEGNPFADAFRVTRDGDTVTIVNAPTTGSLSAVHRAS